MRRALLIGLAGLALVGSACSSNKPAKTVIGVRKVSLAMVFSDQALKVAVPPRVIVKLVPAEPEAILLQVPEAAPYLPPPSSTKAPTTTPKTSPLACPKAPADAPLPEPAPAAITTPPAPPEGTYLQRNQGTLKLNGPVPLSFPYPAFSKLIVRDVKTFDVFDAEFGQKRHTSFVIEDVILPTIRTISYYDHDDRMLNLTKREVINGAQTTTFTPTPPVQVLNFEGPQATWNAAGVDTVSGEAITVMGKIGPNEPVDVCGTLVDTIHASTDEQQVNIRTGNRSGTRTGQPNITGWATRLGGLPVRREQHTNQTVNTDQGPVVLDTDVVSTLMSTSPLPPGAFP